MKRFLLTLGVAAAISGASAAPAGAAESHSVSLAPLTSTWFNVELMPGEEYRGRAVLRNLLDETVNGYLYSVDGFSTPQGGFALAERSARGSSVAEWAGVPPQRMSLKPRETRMVSFTLKVPGIAEPGDYTGGLVFERDRQQAASNGSAKFGLIERVGARIYLTVAGELRPSLTITRLKRTGSRFEMTVLNDGNARLTPQPSLVVTSMLGRKTQIRLDAEPEPLHPQQSVTYKGTWSSPGLLGRFRAGATVAWDRAGAGAGKDSRQTSFWLIPWMLILVLSAAAAILFMGIRRAVRWLRRAREALIKQKAETLAAATPVLTAAIVTSATPVEAPLPPTAPAARPAAAPSRPHKTVQPKRTTDTKRKPVGRDRATRVKAGTISKPRRKPATRSSGR